MKRDEYRVEYKINQYEETTIDRILRKICQCIDAFNAGQATKTEIHDFLRGYIIAYRESGEITEINVISLTKLINSIF